MKKILHSVRISLTVVFIACLQACSNGNIDETKSLIESKYSKEVLNGAFVLFDNGNELIFKTGGIANRSTGDSITRSTPFRIASLTKLFTDIMIIRLYQNSDINIDIPIDNYLPLNSQWSSEITARHLLTSLSGLPREIPGQLGVSLLNGRVIPKLKQIDTLVALNEPGLNYQYSNVGYWLLGGLIEAITGKTYKENLQELSVEIGLKNTGLDDGSLIPHNFAIGYVQGNSDAEYVDYSARFSSGGIYSSAEDLMIFYKALLSNSILSVEMSELYFNELHKDGKRGAGAHLPGFVHHAILDYNRNQILLSLNNIQPENITVVSSVANEVFATLNGTFFHEQPASASIPYVKLNHAVEDSSTTISPYVLDFIRALNSGDSLQIVKMYKLLVDTKIDGETIKSRMQMMRKVSRWNMVGFEDWGIKGINVALENKENQTSATAHFKIPNENGKIPDPVIDWRPEFILRWIHSLEKISVGWPETQMQKRVNDILEAYKTLDGEEIRSALIKNFDQSAKGKKFYSQMSKDFLQQIEEYLGGFEPIEYKQINANELLIVVIGPKEGAEIQLIFISSVYQDDVLLELKATIQNRTY